MVPGYAIERGAGARGVRKICFARARIENASSDARTSTAFVNSPSFGAPVHIRPLQGAAGVDAQCAQNERATIHPSRRSGECARTRIARRALGWRRGKPRIGRTRGGPQLGRLRGRKRKNVGRVAPEIVSYGRRRGRRLRHFTTFRAGRSGARPFFRGIGRSRPSERPSSFECFECRGRGASGSTGRGRDVVTTTSASLCRRNNDQHQRHEKCRGKPLLGSIRRRTGHFGTRG